MYIWLICYEESGFSDRSSELAEGVTCTNGGPSLDGREGPGSSRQGWMDRKCVRLWNDRSLITRCTRDNLSSKSIRPECKIDLKYKHWYK